jgi:CHAD domain-containing protein
MQTSSISIGGELTIEETFAQVLLGNLVHVTEWAPVALAGEDIEGVHQMRVCLRRMRSALTVFRTAIPKKASKSFSNEMRWAAKALDRARDLDVYIAENLASRPKGHQKRLRRLAEQHREQAYRQVERFITGTRYSELCKEFNEWIAERAWRETLSEDQRDNLQKNITPFASAVLEKHRSKILEYGKDIEQLDSEMLHQLRIECKKLRYATEFFSSLYGDQMKEFTGHLKNLQNLLGTLHDTAVMAGLQHDLLKNKKSEKLSKYTQKLERQRQKEAEKILTKASSRWQVFAEAVRPWLTIKEAAA